MCFVLVSVPIGGACSPNASKPLLPLRAPSGLLSSLVAAETGAGTSACPWSIVLPPHQRVNLTLIDYSLHHDGPISAADVIDSRRMSDDGTAGGGGGGGVEYVVVTERGEGRNESRVLRGGVRRWGAVYVSRGSSIQVTFSSSALLANKHFLLKYEGTGSSCA